MRRIDAAITALVVIVFLATGCATQPRPIPLVWNRLPFPVNSDWSGPKGEPATVSGGDLILQGQMVRTRLAYSTTLTIGCDVELEQRDAPDGSFDAEFVPVGSSPELKPASARIFRMIYRNPGAYSGKDALVFVERDPGSPDKTVWGEQPILIRAGKPFHLQFVLTATRTQIAIDGQTYDLNGVGIPYERFVVQLGGWQPTNRWHVRNFSIH
jgi:hypothetical protein